MSGWTVWDFSNAVTPHNARANMYVGYEKWLVSSSIDLTGTSAQLEFDLFYTSYGSANPPTIPASPQGRRFVVLISLDNGGTWNAANTLRQWDDKGSEYVFSQLTNVPQRVIIPLLDGAGNPYTGNVKIAFYAESLINEGDNDLHIDNFQVLGLNPCFYSPTITLQSVTATNATIGFTANDAGVACQYVYAESATITDPDAGTPVSTTDNPFTITGLNPATQYTVWVKAVCGAGYSNWSLPLSFTTEPLPATVPYICTFEDDDPESDLWKKAASGLWGPTMQWYRGTAAGNGGTETGTKAMFTSKDGISFANDVNYTQYAFMWRDIDFGPNVGTYNLKFDFRCEGLVYAGQVYDRIDVLLVDPFEVFNVNTLYGIQIGYTYGSADWSSEVLQISNVSGVQCLMFVGVVLYMNPNAAIDNIKIEEATCIIPYDLLITDMTSSGVTIDFTPTGADFYIASYRTTSSSTIIHETFTAPPYTISIPGGQDLDYVCAVRSVCGEDTTKFSNSLFFTLPCAPFEIPWEEGFESITAHNTLPPCMRATTLGGLVLTSVGPQPQYDLEAHTGNNFACFRYSCDDYIYTPSFDLLNETTYKFSFWYVTTGYSGWQTLQAELRDAITGELVQIIGTPLSNVLNTNWVQFSGVFTPSAAGLYTIAIYCKSTGVQGFLTIDDLALMALDFYTITATAGEGGTIDPAGEIKVNEGDSKTFTITPNTGYHILSVSVDGVPIAYSVNPELTATFTYTFENVTNNHTITATFALNCYLPVINTGDGVTVTPTTCIPHGSSVTFTITPDYCYDITQVLINGVNQGANYTIANVTGKPTIVVSTSLRKYTVTATPAQGIDPLGYITPSGTSSVDCGEDKEYFFHPIEGHRVSGVFVNGEQVPAPNYILNYTLKNIRVNTTIHVEFEKLPQYMIQFGPRAAQNAGGVVFPTKEPDAEFFIYVDTATVSCPFTIEAFDGFEIDKVYVDGAVVNVTGTSTATYEFVNVSANHTIFATFKPIMFTIIATADLNGTINPNGTIQVAWGDDQTFHAIANEGCELIDVIVNGESIGAINSYTFEDVRANGSIHAVFSKIVYPITTAVIGGNGHIIPSANPIMVVHGNSVTLTFVPDQGYTVNTVVIDNVPHPAAALAGTYTFTNVTQAHDVVVTFKKLTYTITSTVTVGGFIDPAGTIFVTHGEHSPTYVFDAYEGYYISSVLVDGVVNHEAMANGIYRFFNVTANHTILVMFARDSYTIAATATQGGSITPSGIVTVPSGTNRRFDFGPQQGFELFRVMIDGLNDEEALANGYYTFMNVLDDHSIATHFRKLTYTVTLPLPDDCTTVIPEDGSTMNIITVEYGDRFAFTVNIADPCSQSNIIVRSNGMIIVPTGGVYTINNITSDQIVTIVNAELNQYRITARAFAGGTIDPDGIYMVTHGSEESFMITPNLNFKIDKVEVNGAPVVLAGNVYTLKNIIADAIIEAHFKRDDVGIDENNPVINVFSYSNLVTIMNKDLVPVKQVEIMDVFGRVVWHGQANSEKTEITLHVAAGIYAVRIHTGDNQYLTTKVVIN
ncbi:MAG: T9SS type A sorting domain-containing protein [Lentimicrobiaceae bacterium]|nr:T9SS type A sorting domain-containing protein [Lentimicrobiaceae bacterium]